jgi:parallel beta-helix repeat protein
MKTINSIISSALISFLLILIVFNFTSIIYNNKNWAYDSYLTSDKVKLKFSEISKNVHIEGNSGWVAYKAAANCTGNGTYSDPYIIEDLVIDDESSGTSILIENSNVYFKIENCTFNSGDYYRHTGIRLNNVSKGKLNNNNCSDGYAGIYLYHCSNITILGNIMNHNYYGLHLSACNDSVISGNFANDSYFGIDLFRSSNTTISGNIMNKCGLIIDGEFEHLISHDIDTTNLVNEKPLYYYKNEVNLGTDDFLDAGKVIMVNCNDSLISSLDISLTRTAIAFYYSNKNSILNNTANNNGYGIQLSFCNNNIITRNNMSNNQHGISSHNCNNNTIAKNYANNNTEWGIELRSCSSNVILENIANYNGYDGISLVFCYNTTITGNSVSNNFQCGINLFYSDFNLVSRNMANYNSFYGIVLILSNNNTVIGNILLGNDKCIHEEYCTGNFFSDNGDCMYGQESRVPIELIILISVLSGGSVICVILVILIRRKEKKAT